MRGERKEGEEDRLNQERMRERRGEAGEGKGKRKEGRERREISHYLALAGLLVSKL